MALHDPGPALVSVAEIKAFLRLDRDDEDALIAGFVRTATALCEAFTGQWLAARDGLQRLAATPGWQRIDARPIIAITTVTAGGFALPGAAYESDIDAGGAGWVRITDRTARDIAVGFRAGLAVDWNGIPEPLRAGIVRLTAHLFSHRDAADAGPPPAAVAALWRPWRVMRLG